MSNVGRAAELWRRMSKITMNACSAGVLACGFTVLSSTVLWAGLGTRKSPKPADKNVCATALMNTGKSASKLHALQTLARICSPLPYLSRSVWSASRRAGAFGRGMVQLHRGAMLIVVKNQNTSSSVGAAWNQNMPRRWGFVRCTFIYYKQGAPTELPPEQTTRKRTASFRSLTTDWRRGRLTEETQVRESPYSYVAADWKVRAPRKLCIPFAQIGKMIIVIQSEERKQQPVY